MLAIAFAGCGGPAYEYDSVVSGTVTVDGELANSGTVAFHPVPKGLPAIGRIHSDGSYSLRTGQGDLNQVDGGTVMPGEYLVTVSIKAPPAKGEFVGEGGPPIPGPSLIASRYATKETTDLRYTVKPGKQIINLNLDRAEPQTSDEQVAQAAETEPSAEVPGAADGAEPREADAENAEEAVTQ